MTAVPAISSPARRKRCRHRGTWIVGGGNGEWCYVCGAYRGLRIINPGESVPRTQWVRPTSNVDDNPYDRAKGLGR